MSERDGSFSDLLRQIHEDWNVHGQDWTLPGFRALAVHRFGTWRNSIRPLLVRKALSILYRTLYRYVRNHYGIELPDTTRIGRRFRIGHQSGIVIHPHAEIGDNCLIRHNVTIGAVSHARGGEAPKLGHGVQVGSGAAILGRITIGDGVRIGPNAVVMTDIPAGAIVVAPASRIVQLTKSQKDE
jgi:serine O-acetyltransferase